VVRGVSVGVVVCSVVVVWASGADDEEACVDVAACPVCVASVSPETCDEVEAASGACTGALRVFAELDLCTARARFVPAPFTEVLACVCVLPGKA
jgi:hypothetical protein